MQDAESEYNESLWNKFEKLAVLESKSTIKIGNYVPKFNLSISRSIIVPVMFVVLIGGLSAMLFSFVDFKKKEAIDKEVPLVANPENFKKPAVLTAKVIKPAKLKVSISTNTLSSTTPSIALIKTPALTPVTNDIKKEESTKVSLKTNTSAINSTSTKVDDSKAKQEVVTAKIEIKKDNTIQPIKKKKKNKAANEELPTIKAVTNLNEGAAEPELDLK
jgi:hypothetical protein